MLSERAAIVRSRRLSDGGRRPLKLTVRRQPEKEAPCEVCILSGSCSAHWLLRFSGTEIAYCSHLCLWDYAEA